MRGPVPERRAPGWLKLVNRVNVRLLRAGVGPAPQRLLSIAGRSSGKVRTTPVALVTLDDCRYVVAGYDGSDWVKNARLAGLAILSRGRHTERVRLHEVPVEKRAPILHEFATQIRGGRSFLTVNKDAPLSEFANVARLHPVFEVQKAGQEP